MAVFHPLKYLLMFDILGAINEESIGLILERGNIFFLTPKPKFHFEQSTIEKRLMVLFDTNQFEHTKEYSITKKIKDQLKTENGVTLEWCIDNSSHGKQMFLGSEHVLRNFFGNEDENLESSIYFLDFKKSRSQSKDRANFFFVMSKILFGNEIYHDMVRLYFYFIYRSLSQIDWPCFFLRIHA